MAAARTRALIHPLADLASSEPGVSLDSLLNLIFLRKRVVQALHGS